MLVGQNKFVRVSMRYSRGDIFGTSVNMEVEEPWPSPSKNSRKDEATRGAFQPHSKKYKDYTTRPKPLNYLWIAVTSWKMENQGREKRNLTNSHPQRVSEDISTRSEKCKSGTNLTRHFPEDLQGNSYGRLLVTSLQRWRKYRYGRDDE